MNLLKSRWKEIVLVLSVVLVTVLLCMFIKSLLLRRENALLEQQRIKNNYNNILSGETSEEILQNELSELLTKKNELETVLPKGFKIQDANMKMVDIVKNTKIMDVYDCSVSEVTTNKSDSNYVKMQIKVNNFYGTYAQIKEFIEFIDNYHMKLVIEQMNFELEDYTKNMDGENLIISLYGMV